MDWRKEVNQESTFLHYYDIADKSPVTVTIDGFDREDAYCPGENKAGSLWCVRFKGASKMLGLNVTNGNLIEHLHGADPEKWVGKKITLRVAECKGEKCIRVDAPGAKLPKACPRFKYIDGNGGQ